MNAIIEKTIGIGDGGWPFDVTIDVEYEQQGLAIIVTDWMQRESPYDNPPESWFTRMKEIIEDYFYELNEHFQVTFQ